MKHPHHSAPVLEVSELRVSFSQYGRGLRRRVVTPVVDMSLSVDAGEVVALIGASGAGKSLVGTSVMGLLPANASESGTISIHGVGASPAQRRGLAGRGVALLPQSPSHLDPLVRVGAQVRRAAVLAGIAGAEAEAAATDALRRRGLEPKVASLYPHELSGGMARRVLFAMVTLGEPELIFADEPTPGLDPESAREVISDIRSLADSGSAVVLVSHDLALALPIADRVIVAKQGRTVEEARPIQFTGNGHELKHPYSRELWQALPQHGFRLPARRALNPASLERVA